MDFNGIGFIIINLIILALNLKMYTEYFKDKKIDKRLYTKGKYCEKICTGKSR